MCHRDLFKVTGDGAKDRRKVFEEEDYEEEALGRTQHHEEGSGGWVYGVEEAVAEAVAEYDEVLAAYSDARRNLNQLRVSRGFYPVVAMVLETKDSYPRKG